MATSNFARLLLTRMPTQFMKRNHLSPIQSYRFVTIYHSKDNPVKEQKGKSSPIEDEKYLSDLQRGVQQAHQEGNYEEALKLAIHAQKEMADYFGLDHPVNASAWNNIAIMNKKLGYFDAAIEAYLKALSTYRSAAGEKHPQYVASLANLGLCFQSAAVSKKISLEKIPFLERAIETFEEVLSLRESFEISYSDHGASHANTLAQARHHLSLARFYLENETKSQKSSSIDSSFDYLNDAIVQTTKYLQTLRDRLKGKQNVEIATALNNLGFLLKCGQNYSESQYHYEEALQIRTNLLGSIHPDTIACKNNLAELYLASGEKDKALILQTEILEDLGVDDVMEDDEDEGSITRKEGVEQVSADFFNNKLPMQ